MKRYTIHAIADADCTQLHDEILAESDDLEEANELAIRCSNSLFGSAIRDHRTGMTDFGEGFVPC